AYDFQLDYRINTTNKGAWHLYAIATHQTQYENQTLPNVAPISSVGYNNGVLPWRGNFGLDWEADAWALGWNAQYFDPYHVYSATASASSRAATVLNQGSDEIPSQMYHDLYATYRFDQGRLSGTDWLSGAEISLSLQNVLDKEPPALA